MPIDYKKYPVDWKDVIRPRILKRDNYRCRLCHAANRAPYYKAGHQRIFIENSFDCDYAMRHAIPVKRIVLTIAHIIHDNSIDDDNNLLTLCTTCHLIMDAKMHASNRFLNKAKK